ncbi:Uncharacterised protein [Chryseobacterium nakagawai]|nr:Uncharacterised protein [Chryseobacterium nakagawai]
MFNILGVLKSAILFLISILKPNSTPNSLFKDKILRQKSNKKPSIKNRRIAILNILTGSNQLLSMQYNNT